MKITELINSDQLFEHKFELKTKKDKIINQWFNDIIFCSLQIFEMLDQINYKIDQRNKLLLESYEAIKSFAENFEKINSILDTIVVNQREFVDVSKILNDRFNSIHKTNIKIERFYDYFKIILDLLIESENKVSDKQITN